MSKTRTLAKIAALILLIFPIISSQINAQCTVDAGPDIEVCEGESITLNAIASGGDGDYSYFWNFSFGVGPSHTFTPLANPNQNLTHTYSVTVLDGSGCITTDDVVVKVFSNPQASAVVTHPDCTTQGEITFTFPDHINRTGIEFSLDGGLNYQAMIPDNSGSVSYSVMSGVIDAYVRWGNNDCPVHVGDFTVNPSPGPSFDVGADFDACDGDFITFSPTVSGGVLPYSYTWDNGITTGTGLSVTLLGDPNQNQDQTFNYTVTDGNGCFSVSSVTVDVRSRPVVTVLTTDKDCSTVGNLEFQFPDHPTRIGLEFSLNGGASYGSVVADNTGNVSYNVEPGTYQCFARWGNDQCPIDLGSFDVLDNGGYGIEIGGNQTICDGETLTITPSLTGTANNPTYTWTYGSQSGTGLIIDLTGNPNANTSNTLIINSVDDNGCISQDSKTITIESSPTVTLTKQDISCFTVGQATFTFQNHPNRTGIKFSVDGGASYLPNVLDNTGSKTYNLEAGSYHAMVRWGNNECPIDLGPFDIIDDGTSLNLSLNTSSIISCDGESITLSPTVTGGTGSYTYTYDNGTDSGTGLTFTPSGNSSANVVSVYEVIVTDSAGCLDRDEVTINVRSLPTVTNVTTENGCATNASVTFEFDDHPNRSQLEFSLDGGVSYEPSLTDMAGSVSYALSAGTYNFYSRWGNGQCPIDLGVFTIDELEFDMELGPDLTSCEGDEITLTPTHPEGVSPYTYSWSNGVESGTGLTFVTTGSASFNSVYSYTVNAMDANGCETSDDLEITVLSYPSAQGFGKLVGCLGDAEVEFSFTDHPDNTALQFSLDGGTTYESPVADNASSVSYAVLAGAHDTYVRWDDSTCPIQIGNVEIIDADIFYSAGSGFAGDPLWIPDGGTDPIAIEFCLDRSLVVRSGHSIDSDKLVLAHDLEIESGARIDVSSSNYSVEITGDFVCSGDFVAHESLFRFVGSSDQQISGGIVSMHDVELNSGRDLDLLTAMNINGTFFPESGTFRTNTNEFTLVSELVGGNVLTGAIGEIKSTAQFIGDIKIQRYVESLEDGYRLIGNPILDQTVADFQGDFITTGYPGSDYPAHYFTNVKYYNEPSHAPNDIDPGFLDVTSSADIIDNEKGYWAYFPPSSAANVLESEGEFRQGDVTFNLSHTETGDDYFEGWNCVPNPYPCAIDMMSNSIDFVNTDRAIYILDHTIGGTWKGEYVVYNNGVSVNGGSNLIASYQAFFVKADGPGASITFREPAKTTAQGQFYRSQEIERPLLRISLNNETDKYESVIAFHEEADASFNSNFDAYKRESIMFSIGTVSESDTLSINTLSDYNEELEIPIYVYAPEAGEYELKLDEIEHIEDNLCLVIKDLVTGDQWPFDEDSPVPFTTSESYIGTRFLLTSKPVAQIRIDSPTCAEGSDATIEISTLIEGNYGFTLSGDFGGSMAAQNQSGHSLIEGIEAGNYQLELIDETGLCGSSSYDLQIWPTPELSPSSVSFIADHCALNQGELFVSAEHQKEMVVQLYAQGELIEEAVGQELIAFESLAGEEYTVLVTTECGEETHTVDIQNQALVVADFTLSEFEEMFNGEVTLTLEIASLNSIHNEWYVNGEFICDGEFCAHTITEAGVYEVKLISSDGNCAKEKIRTIMITESETEFETVDPNFTLGITDDHIEVNGNSEEHLFDLVEVFDVSGKLVKSYRTGSISSYVVNHSGISSGTYIMRLSYQGNTVQQTKFLK